MQIIIQTLNFKPSDGLESFINEKLAKIDHHSHGITRADVTLSKGPEAEVNNNYCEIQLDMPGKKHFAKKNSDKFEHSITDAVEALLVMIAKDKDKEISKRHSEIPQ